MAATSCDNASTQTSPKHGIRYATEAERQHAKRENNRRYCHEYYERRKKHLQLQRLQKKLALLQAKVAALTIEVANEASPPSAKERTPSAI